MIYFSAVNNNIIIIFSKKKRKKSITLTLPTELTMLNPPLSLTESAAFSSAASLTDDGENHRNYHDVRALLQVVGF